MATLIKKIEKNGIGRIILNRENVHNALDEALISALTQTIIEFENNSAIRIIVLTGNGKSFCAGADLHWMKRTSTYSWEENYQDALKLASLLQTLYQSSKTTLAIVQGNTYGGGIGLIACCDIALASESATFCLPEVKLGLIPAVISPYVLKAIGVRQAKRYFSSGETFNAQQAKTMNLVHALYHPSSLYKEADSYLLRLIQNGPDAMRLSKQLINRVDNRPIDEALIKETAHQIANIRSSDEGKEGIAAFLKKRPANWTTK